MSKKKPKIVFLHGLPGSGKSTIAEKYIADRPEEKIVRINRDDIRTIRFGEKYHSGNFPRKSEDEVTRIQDDLLRKALAAGHTVIDDNTNLNGRSVFKAVRTGREYGAEFEQIHVDVPVEEAKRRNKLRGDAGGRRVPDHVIDRMADFGYADGHIKNFKISTNGVFPVARTTSGGKLVEEYNRRAEQKHPFKGKAVALVDVDGTLANNAHDAARHLHRGPGEKKDFPSFYKAIAKAPVNPHVRDLANQMRDQDGINLVVLTGRDDSYAKELLDFIDRSGIKASRVIAKQEGDFRPDYEYKKEILDDLKSEGLIAVHAFDDREGSIRTIEAAGVMVSRVATPELHPGSDLRLPAPTPEVNTIYGSGYCIRCGKPIKTGNIGQVCKTKPW